MQPPTGLGERFCSCCFLGIKRVKRLSELKRMYNKFFQKQFFFDFNHFAVEVSCLRRLQPSTVLKSDWLCLFLSSPIVPRTPFPPKMLLSSWTFLSSRPQIRNEHGNYYCRHRKRLVLPHGYPHLESDGIPSRKTR